MRRRRREKWANELLIRLFPPIFALIYAFYFGLRLFNSDGVLDSQGRMLGSDFTMFWLASNFVLEGDIGAVYDWDRVAGAQRALFGYERGLYAWSYPPIFLLYALPLALLPYAWAYVAWCVATFAALAAVVRKIAPARETLWLLVGFPATLVNGVHGQNGFLTAALFGGALSLINKRPVVAGVLFGLLTYKPQFGVLIPVALIAGRCWTAFASAAVTTVVLLGVSTAGFGVEPWVAFWHNMPELYQAVIEGRPALINVPSLMITLHLLGVDDGVAQAFHVALALAVAAVVAWVWYVRGATVASAAVLATGAFFVPPHPYGYDLALLAVPIALIGWAAYRDGLLWAEREVLVLAWLTPILVWISVAVIGVQIGTACLLAVFAICVRRALAGGGDHDARL